MSILLSTLVLFAILILANYACPWIFRWIQVARWNRIRGFIALTFDDGPDPVTTQELLDLLERLNVPATFYLVGFRAQECPEVVERIRHSGHLIGSHSQYHYHAWKVAPWKELGDAAAGLLTLKNTIDSSSPFRPPFGKITLLTLCWHWLNGREVHWWCFDTDDTADEHPDPAILAKQIVESGKPVVLMHCHHAEDHKRQFILSLTAALVEKARADGLEFVTMDGIQARV